MSSPPPSGRVRTAAVLDRLFGWAARGERLTVAQIVGSLLVLGSVWVGQRPQRATAVPAVKSRAGALAN